MKESDSRIDAAILVALRDSADGSASGADLSQRLGVTRAAIWSRIEALRELGFDIEASPHKGYRLVSSPDQLYADDLIARLKNTLVVGRTIRVFEETNSTNDLVDRLAKDGVNEGMVVFAESQTKGRGRLGRQWTSPRGKGLWFSVLLRPKLPPQSATQITIAAATALARSIRKTSDLVPEIKWPNDILIKGRKLTGILTELSAELDKIKYLVIGIGINVNIAASEFGPELRKTATSLLVETGHTISRPELAAVILRELDYDYCRISQGHFDEVSNEWQQQCSTIGQQIAVHIGKRKIVGRAESLDADGALLLRAQHGHLERIIGGDVTIEK